MPSGRRRPAGVLIAAEGPDGAGKSAGLELLSRWLERRGRQVQVVRWDPSRLIDRVRGNTETAGVLTTRVAALLTAADAAHRADRDITPALARGSVVLADRYAWSAIAREVARGLDPGWVGRLYSFLPRPDLVLLHRLDPATAVARALAVRPSSVQDEAVASAFAAFLERLEDGYVRLVDHERSDAMAGPWPVDVLELDARQPPEALAATVREAVRPFIDASRPQQSPDRERPPLHSPAGSAA